MQWERSKKRESSYHAQSYDAKVVNIHWEVLPHPLFSPDIATSDYYLFKSIQHDLVGIRF